MLNARTWHRLCLSAYLMFPALVVLLMQPKGSLLLWPALVVVLWGALVAVVGAGLGILLACGRLYLGCPECGARSHVSGAHRRGMWLECPQCGGMLLKIGQPSRLVATPAGLAAEADGYPATGGEILRAPLSHPVIFAVMYLPVVASIVAAAVIHEFSFFYLIIPGFWCYAVAGFCIHDIEAGSLTDNTGTVTRSAAPFRFWMKVGIWLLFYLMAMAFPIGYAMQERDRAGSAKVEARR